MTSWGARHHGNPDSADQQAILSKAQAAAKCSNMTCPIGNNCDIIDYQNPGEIIDHMYAKQGIKYSTLWEVWAGESGCLSQFNPLDGKVQPRLNAVEWFLNQHVPTNDQTNENIIETYVMLNRQNIEKLQVSLQNVENKN